MLDTVGTVLVQYIKMLLVSVSFCFFRWASNQTLGLQGGITVLTVRYFLNFNDGGLERN